MPRAKSLADDDIVDAALALLDRAGPSALSMRAIAEKLGVGTMSLYRYVSDREHLERLLVDRVLGGVDTHLSPRLAWRSRLATLAERARNAIAGHPSIVPIVLAQRHASPHSIRWGEAVLGVLHDAGFSGRRRVIAFRALLAYVMGSIQLEHLGPLSGPGTRALADLPPQDFPNLARAARDARHVDRESEFRLGLDVVLRGLEERGRR